MVRAGQFREDLLFRLKAFAIEIAPLRERGSDIEELALWYLAKLSKGRGEGQKGISPEFMEALNAYPWPGNVRELYHAVERAITAAHMEPTLFPKHLPDEIRIYLAKESLDKTKRPATDQRTEPADPFPSYKEHREASNQRYFRDLLDRTEGNVTKASQIARLSRSRLYELLKRYDLITQ
jgi:two-component system NtrC family response regulator